MIVKDLAIESQNFSKISRHQYGANIIPAPLARYLTSLIYIRLPTEYLSKYVVCNQLTPYYVHELI